MLEEEAMCMVPRSPKVTTGESMSTAGQEIPQGVAAFLEDITSMGNEPGEGSIVPGGRRTLPASDGCYGRFSNGGELKIILTK